MDGNRKKGKGANVETDVNLEVVEVVEMILRRYTQDREVN